MDLDLARERFESSVDFTIGLEEEFAILNPETLELEHRFEDVHAACLEDEVLAESAAGELIDSEIEIRSGRAESFAEAVAKQRERRRRLFELTEGMGLALGAMGTHPWADYLDQRIIDTPHYRRNDELLQYVVWRNNTFGVHTHVAIRGADRAVRVVDALRNWLPELLAVSAPDFELDRRLLDVAGLNVDVAGRDLDLKANRTRRWKGLGPHGRLLGRRRGGRWSIFTST